MSTYPFLDGDLSWLSFNERVLSEAKDRSVPTLERLRFLAFYSRNLDRYLLDRAADIRYAKNIKKSKVKQQLGFSPKEKLQLINQKIAESQNDFDKTLREVLKSLELKKVYVVDDPHSLSEESRNQLIEYFRLEVMGRLHFYVFGDTRKKPFLQSQGLYFAIKLESNESYKYAFVSIPSDELPRFYKIFDGETYRFVYLDDIVKMNLNLIFGSEKVLECKSIILRKKPEQEISDEYPDATKSRIEKLFDKHPAKMPVIFTYDRFISDELLSIFQESLELEQEELFAGGKRHNLSDLKQINDVEVPGIKHPELVPAPHNEIEKYNSLFEAIEASDQLLHFPYHSFDYIYRFLSEASIDPHVKEINATFFEITGQPYTLEILINAAVNRKKVAVFITKQPTVQENIFSDGIKRLRKSGAKVYVGLKGMKSTGTKILVRKKNDNETVSYAFFATGNLTEISAKTHCNYGLFTYNTSLTDELEQLFYYLQKGKDSPKLNLLLVSSFNLIDQLQTLINQEIHHAQEKKETKIILKLNHLEDKELIGKLYEAASKGVTITLFIRGICRLVPGIMDIRVYRLVDRFLENSRIYYFHNAGKEELYLGSADWCTKALYHQVEVMVPVQNPKIRSSLFDFLDLAARDNTKMVQLTKDGHNEPLETSEPFINAQSMTYQSIQKSPQ